MRLIKTIGWIAVVLAVITFASCKKKEVKKEMTEEEARAKFEATLEANIEKTVLNYAMTDEDLGEYDSIKFVDYSPYFKSEYCATMVGFLSKQRDALQSQFDSAVANRDNDALIKVSESMDRINNCLDYYNKQSSNTLATKDDPVVLYEAKCYCYTDGYIQEYIYYVTKDWKVIVLDPYDLDFLK